MTSPYKSQQNKHQNVHTSGKTNALRTVSTSTALRWSAVAIVDNSFHHVGWVGPNISAFDIWALSLNLLQMRLTPVAPSPLVAANKAPDIKSNEFLDFVRFPESMHRLLGIQCVYIYINIIHIWRLFEIFHVEIDIFAKKICSPKFSAPHVYL